MPLSNIPSNKQVRVELTRVSTGEVLKNVSFQLTPGEITLLIAPVSTGGETAIVDIISGDTSLKTGGNVLYNGRPTPPTGSVAVVSAKSVDADAACVGHAVQRSVQAAHTSRKADVGALTDELISATGLSAVKYTPLAELEDTPGGAHLLRRVALACALASDPVVLLLQEPFAEATPEQATSLVALLRTLADGGRTVVLGSEEGLDDAQYAAVDTCVLLSKGRLMYYGVASEAVSWFAAQGHAKPAGQAVADFLVNLADAAVDEDGEEGEMHRAESVEVAAAYLKAYPHGYKGGPVPEMTDDEDDDEAPAANGKGAKGAGKKRKQSKAKGGTAQRRRR